MRTPKSTDWSRVSVAAPCPICWNDHWCGMKGGDVVRCMRVNDAPNGWRRLKQDDDGGTVFIRKGSKPQGKQSSSQPTDTEQRPTKNWKALSAKYERNLTSKRVNSLANDLGVSEASLRQINAGYSLASRCYTFPHRDGQGRIIGIAKRFKNGSKAMFKGSRLGVIIPNNLAGLPDPVLLVEGPTDVAACLTMNLAVIGRPNNVISRYLAEVVGDREIIVVGEFDPKQSGDWPGRDGAIKVATTLASELLHPVSWALPPKGAKDIREWVSQQENNR